MLGTTGIVEPMSEKALTDTIFLEMKMLRENGTSTVIWYREIMEVIF